MHTALHHLTQHSFAHGEAYDRIAGKVFGGAYRRVADDVAATAPKGGVVLDAGCGTGRLAVQIADRRPDVHIYGVDLEAAMVDVARQRTKQLGLDDQIEFTIADLADLSLPGQSVDLVVSTASLHHWTDVDAVVASLDRVLRSDGWLWIYDLRPVAPGAVQAAASKVNRRVERALVRTGWFPAALLQRFALVAAWSAPDPST
jgi:ubiquinone/menaquinone biosynthesis C-methylase UbiE